MIDTAVSVAVSFTDVRGWPSMSGRANKLHVKTAPNPPGRCRDDLESVLGSRPRGFESRILRAADQQQRRAAPHRVGPALSFSLTCRPQRTRSDALDPRRTHSVLVVKAPPAAVRARSGAAAPEPRSSVDQRGVLVRQGWPALRGPLRPGRVLWWDGWNLRTSQFVVVRRLKLSPPLLKFNVAHVERVIGRSREPSGDAPALLLVVNR